jgi:hypothetical protein
VITDDPEDIAALRADGDLVSYLLSLAGATPPKPAPAEPQEPEEPDYVIPHRGAWPIGSAASGPTPTHGKCTCPRCAQKGTP